MPWRIVAVTYELADDGREIPVVRHELYGDTRERAVEVLEAHCKSDRFLRACLPAIKRPGVTWSKFEGRVECRTTVRLERIWRIPR
jgi:hypothetical protein